MRVKICGITNVEDALMSEEAGADAIGVNLVPSSARLVSEERAREIVNAVGPRLLVVGIVADRDPSDMAALLSRVGLGCLQLHGHESPAALRRLLPHAYKALRIGTAEDVLAAELYAGDYLLVDAKHPDVLGGSGRTVDWRLVEPLARRRRLVLAGGLTPENVGEAVGLVQPDCVDVASGVEFAEDPRRKDPARLRAFIAAARRTSA